MKLYWFFLSLRNRTAQCRHNQAGINAQALIFWQLNKSIFRKFSFSADEGHCFLLDSHSTGISCVLAILVKFHYIEGLWWLFRPCYSFHDISASKAELVRFCDRLDSKTLILQPQIKTSWCWTKLMNSILSWSLLKTWYPAFQNKDSSEFSHQ